jgi:DNA-directed RNA polymerase beta' subunit
VLRGTELMRESHILADGDVRCFSALRALVPEDKSRPGDMAPETRPVVGYELGLLSESDLLAQSVVRISDPEWISRPQPANGATPPRPPLVCPNGPLSPFMGPIERTETCWTCQGVCGDDYALAPDRNGIYPCPGHFGHINLPGATFGVTFTNPLYATIIHMIRCICPICGRLPADKAKRAKLINAVLRCDVDGMPLDRDRRLDLVCKSMQSETMCHQCTADLPPCTHAHSPTSKQCASCAARVEYRAYIMPRGGPTHKGGANTFSDFPHAVTFGLDRMSADEKAEFQRFRERHRKLTETVLSFNPERARHMWSTVGADVALLLAPHLPHGPFATSGDLYERVFPGRTPEQLAQLRREMIEVAIETFNTQVNRVVGVIPPLARPTRINGGLHDVEPNEMTKVIANIVKTCDQIWEMADRINDAENTSMPPLAPFPDVIAPRDGVGDRQFAHPSEAMRTLALLRHADGARWYEKTRADHHFVATLYGTLQYLVSLLNDPSQAARWHPQGSSAPRPNSTKPGANATVDQGHAPVNNLKGKENRFRANLTGKRVDFTCRNVIVPDPDLDIDELHLPYWMAARLTYTDTLNDLNYQTLLDAAERRRLTMIAVHEACQVHDAPSMRFLPDKVRARLFARTDLDQDCLHMGRMTLYLWNAERTKKYDYTKFRVPVHQHPVARESGSALDRPPRNGDTIVWNRAPSLHLVSMMAHTIVLTNKHASAMDASDTTPYNADFDGDEMNGHLPQSPAVVAEVRSLMLPSRNILLPRTSSSIIAQVQDALLGACQLSMPGTLLTYAEMCDMLMVARNHRVRPDDDDPFDDDQFNGAEGRFPQPAVRVRCPGNGEHRVVPRCTGICHAAHEPDEQCTTPCHRHDADCEARAPELGTSSYCDEPHLVPMWTGLQLVSLFMPRWLSASKHDTFVPGELGFRTTPKPIASDGDARARSMARDAAAAPPSEKQTTARRRGDIPWHIDRGELLYGVLNKSAVGVGHRNIVQHLLMTTGVETREDATGQYGERNRLAAIRQMRALKRTSIAYLTHTGVSVGLGDLMLDNERVDAQIALAIYGVKRPPMPTDAALEAELRAAVRGPLPRCAVLSEKRRRDPVKYDFPRYELEPDDKCAVEVATLERLKIPYKPNQPGVERVVAGLIQAHYAEEAKKGGSSTETALPARQRKARLETRIRSACDVARDTAHAAVTAVMSMQNTVARMAFCGSKGSLINIGSMIACVGLQTSGGKRLCDRDIITFGNETDTGDASTSATMNPSICWYPHTARGIPQGAGAAGMVKRGYLRGCTPHEFVNQCHGGRDGLIDTAVKVRRRSRER